MANSKVSQIAGSTSEDFIDEAVSGYTYWYTKQAFEPLLNKISGGKEDSILREALEGAINTLQFGIMNAVMITVTEYAFSKLALTATATIAFLKATYIAQKARKLITGALGAVPFVGKGLGNVVSATGSFLSSDRQQIATMANNTSNNLTTVVSQERQNQIMIRGYQHKSADNNTSNAIRLKQNGDNKYITIFTHKTMTGTWLNTTEDKRIYEKATNTTVKSSGTATWSVLYSKLNQFSEFAKTAEGVIMNNTMASVKMLEAQGAKLS
ncbi:hypothetical protein [Arcobacter sp. F2176]|uniref:hypothetical protein n=1 Tax=Arcobacter sp. F2176 TaxID=2044511 RepID=UPI00100B90AF|nr:hypothetical protein [Arcobacter sp. F2176]RXJ82647.1 hypothetical protein CRU95_00860 [Arcobacter sp. F2176]